MRSCSPAGLGILRLVTNRLPLLGTQHPRGVAGVLDGLVLSASDVYRSADHRAAQAVSGPDRPLRVR